MKRKQITAILLSAVMTVSACMPMNGISAFAAESAGEGNTEIAAAEEQEEEPAAEAEPETAEPAMEEQEELSGETEVAAEPEEAETEEAEEPESEVHEESDEVTEDEEAVPASDAEEVSAASEDTTEEEAEEAVEEETTAPVEEETQEVVEEETAVPAEEETAAPAEHETDQADAAQESAGKQDDAEEIIEKEKAETEKGKEAKKAETAMGSSFDNAIDLEVGGSYDAVVSEQNPNVYLRITPDETSYYRMYSQTDSGADTYATLYNADQLEIDCNDDDEGYQFGITAVLMAGKTYYLEARLCNTDNSGEFTVYLEKGDSDVGLQHEGESEKTVYYVPEKEVTLSAYAYSSAGEVTYTWTDDEGSTVAGNISEYTFAPTKEGYIYCTATDGIDSFTWSFYMLPGNNLQIHREDFAQRVPFGESVTMRMTVTAVDTSQLQYSWYRCEGEYEEWGDNNWVLIEGADQTEYTIGRVESKGYYRFSVNDQYGNGASTDIFVGVENHFKAYALESDGEEEWPVESKSVYAEPNHPATLSVTAEADDMQSITFKWYKNGVEIAGAGSADYVTAPVTSRDTYRCDVSDPYGNSESVFFYVYPDNKLFAYNYVNDIGENLQHSTVYAALNETAALHVFVEAIDTEGITYSWYTDGDQIEGADSADYVTEPVTGVKEYECTVTDRYGNTSTASFLVGVETHLEAYPEGHEGETNCTIYSNGASSVTLKVVASADDGIDLSYEWYDQYNGEVLSETSSEYVVDPVSGEHSIGCRVRDSFGNEKTIGFWVIEGHFDNYLDAYDRDRSFYSGQYSVEKGGSRTLAVEVEARDTSAITYEWQKGPFDSEDEGFVTIEGATAAEYTIENLQEPASYRCVVRDQYEGYKEVTYHITIENNLNVYAGENSHSYTFEKGVPFGTSLDLTVSVEADDTTELKYQWCESDHDNFDDAPSIPGAISKDYHVESVESPTYYYCLVTDQYGNRDYAEFYVYVENNLTAYPFGESERTDYTYIDAVPGEPVTLKTMVKADDMSELSCKWYDDDGEELYYDNELNSGMSEYTTEPVNSEEQYRCVVRDQYRNSRTVYFYVRPDSKLQVTAVGYGNDSYVEVGVPYNGQKTLQVKASVAHGDLTYRWEQDGDVVNEGSVDGQEGIIELTIGPVTERTYYECRVEDSYGQSQSIGFRIYVENNLKVYPEGANGSYRTVIYAAPGTKVDLHAVVEAKDREDLDIYWWCDGSGHVDSKEEYVTVDADNTTYVCEVQDKYGNNKSAEFEILIENHLEAYPEGAELDRFGDHYDTVNLTPKANQALNLKVIANADAGALRYSWEKREAYTTIWGENEYRYEEIKDQTGDTLSITADKSAEYCCTVRDDYGNSNEVFFCTHVSTLSAYPEGAEVVDGLHNDRAVITTDGGSTTLRVVTNAPAGAQLTYKWTEGELNSSGWWPLEEGVISNAKELTINATESKRYLCVVTDQFGNQALSYFNVNVGGIKLSSSNGEPVMTGDNEYELVVPLGYGKKTTLKTLVEGSTQGGLSYEWTSLYDGYMKTLDETGDSITVTGGDSRLYKCTVTNANGNRATFIYRMNVKPYTVRPAGAANGSDSVAISAAAGEMVTMKAEISGTIEKAYPYYSWRDSRGNYLGSGESCTIRAAGKATYTCKVRDDLGNEQIIYFHILSKDESIRAMDISLKTTAYTYDGKEKKPAAVVKYRGVTLVNGKDYKVTYSANVNAGTAKATVTGISMKGSVTREFKINKAEQVITAKIAKGSIPVGKTTTVSVTGAKGKTVWKSEGTSIATVTGTTVKGIKVGTTKINVTADATANYNAATASVTVKVLPAATTKMTAANLATGIKLTWAKVAGANGYIIYRNNVKIKTITSGTTVTFTDTKANKNGTKYVYKVVAKAATGTSTLSRSLTTYWFARPSITYLKNDKARMMTVKWGKNAKGSGYQIQYALKSSFAGAKTVTATKNTIVTKSVTRLTKGKVYYVRVRTYQTVGGTKYYSAWSAAKKVKIVK